MTYIWALTRDLEYHGHGYYEMKKNGQVLMTSFGNRPSCGYVFEIYDIYDTIYTKETFQIEEKRKKMYEREE